MDRAKERTKWKFKWGKSSNANRSWSVKRKKQHTHTETHNPKSQNKTEQNWTMPTKKLWRIHTARERNCMIFIIISISTERFQSISSDITKSIATLILSKHQFYWYFNPINYIFAALPTSNSFFFSIFLIPFTFAVVLLVLLFVLLLLLCHCSISAWKAWE